MSSNIIDSMDLEMVRSMVSYLTSFFRVSDFAKKTGDYPSLSAVDIRVLALTYQLEKEFCGDSHIKKEPEHKVGTGAVEITISFSSQFLGQY